ncbi:MAG: secretion protein F [Lachnospiraceae bacterium]|nr:secretion protein F [Lachnospiraceae bacterium]
MKEQGKKEESAVLKFFYKAAELLYEKMPKIGHKKLEEEYRILEPSENTENVLRRHFVSKMGLCLLLLTAGICFAAVLHLKSIRSGVLEEGNRIRRNETLEGDIMAEFTVTVGEETLENFEVVVEEKALSSEEIREILPDFYRALEEELLGENVSADEINKPLVLSETVEGYPFFVSYEIGNREVLSRDGEPKQEAPPEGTLTEIIALITYGDYGEEYVIPLMVYPPEDTKTALAEAIREYLEQNSKETEEEEYFYLPSEWEGMKVTWTEQKKEKGLVVLGLVAGACIAVYFGKDREVSKRMEERKQEMEEDYPEIISKLTLFIGAGMSVRGAWKKIAMDYRTKKEKGGEKRYAYEEMLFTVYELERGIEEVAAYGHFSRRCGVQRYVKMVALLEQNAKMGSRGLLSSLQRESKDAFEERKSRAERKGEEAGTKLLVPMFMMLIIVMAVIMVPAMTTMG